MSRLAAVVLGQELDRRFGEPPNAIHPLVAIGIGLTSLERRTYRANRRAGVVHLVASVSLAGAGALVLQRLVGRRAASALVAFMSTGERMLLATAIEVGEALDAGAIDQARELLPSLVGRDPTGFGESEIARAVIESVAENTVDAVTATLWWGVIGGAPAMVVHRVTNTLDAMIGHRSGRYEDFGWAAARFDDLLNFVPARITAGAMAVSRPGQFGTVMRTVRRDGARHPSPNGGRVEAAMAARLGVTLGGSNDYAGRREARGPLGDGPPPEAADIAEAVAVAKAAIRTLTVTALLLPPFWRALTTCRGALGAPVRRFVDMG